MVVYLSGFQRLKEIHEQLQNKTGDKATPDDTKKNHQSLTLIQGGKK
jgi:hypothetical protein